MDVLREQLGADPPAGFSRLPAKDLRDLAQALEEVRHAQTAELKAAGEKAYAQIPWLLRGPIRKIVG